MTALAKFPDWVYILDYFIAFMMWLLILRFFFNITFSSNTNFKIIVFFFRLTDKLISFFENIIPSFIPAQLKSIFLAWSLFMIRFYFLPLVEGYEAIGYLSFPFETKLYTFVETLLFS
tara:strand:+ start:119 stop:472 length:354 start_codon:yes stop_codon:yes gene_type:complete